MYTCVYIHTYIYIYIYTYVYIYIYIGGPAAARGPRAGGGGPHLRRALRGLRRGGAARPDPRHGRDQ